MRHGALVEQGEGEDGRLGGGEVGDGLEALGGVRVEADPLLLVDPPEDGDLLADGEGEGEAGVGGGLLAAEAVDGAALAALDDVVLGGERDRSQSERRVILGAQKVQSVNKDVEDRVSRDE